MMGFFTAHFNAQLSKLRADQARMHIENCNLRAENRTLRADNDWLLKMGREQLAEQRRQRNQTEFLADENAALHQSLAMAVENNRRISMELLKALGHPSMRAQLKRIALWN